LYSKNSQIMTRKAICQKKISIKKTIYIYNELIISIQCDLKHYKILIKYAIIMFLLPLSFFKFFIRNQMICSCLGERIYPDLRVLDHK
jgi:hypothetical protein